MEHLVLPEITDETMRAALPTTRSYTAVILKRTARFARPAVDPIVWEHGRRNFALRAAGWLPIVCPVMDDSDVAGFGIFNADVDQTREIMDEDPGVLAGIFTYEAHACRGFPGSSLPEVTLAKP